MSLLSSVLFFSGSLFSVSTSSPLLMSLILLGMSLVLGSWLSQTVMMWGFYVMVLIFSGGMMVLLLYACVLNTGEKLIKGPRSGLMLTAGMCALILSTGEVSGQSVLGWKMNTLLFPLEVNSLLLLGGYLLVVLILSVKLSSPFKGAMTKYF